MVIIIQYAEYSSATHSRLGFMTGASVGCKTFIFEDLKFDPRIEAEKIFDNIFKYVPALLEDVADISVIAVGVNSNVYKTDEDNNLKKLKQFLIERIKKEKGN